MKTERPSISPAEPGEVARYDAIVIGAGMAGMYALHRLRGLGLSVRVFEAADDVGGTWWWNRYPGARFDSESWTYGYSFDEEILQEWSWSEHFAAQPETLRYCNYVADKLNLRRDITFNVRVASATWLESETCWAIETTEGLRARSQFLVTAVGPLSSPVMPQIPGIDDFQGESYHTGKWPHEPVSFEGKRVGVIGTGATAVQAITEIAKTAGTLTVFQRTPNWCAPLHNSRIDDETQSRIKSTYDDIFAICHDNFGGFVHVADPRSALEVSDEERETVFEKLYGEPGFGIWMGNFRDLMLLPEANATISDFMARKIRARVKDPAVAEKLVPKDHGFGMRRVPLESGYYEVYNQPNVQLVDVRESPIERITPTGIKTADAEYDLDMIIYATGFDPITGSFDRIDIAGENGLRLKDVWAEGPRTYLGLAVAGFPNMLTLVGPHNAAIFCNLPRCIEQNVNFVADLLGHMREKGLSRVAPTAEAQEQWTALVNEIGRHFLFTKVDSWMTGVNKNVPGRLKRNVMVFAGGVPQYRALCEAQAANGYPSFALS